MNDEWISAADAFDLVREANPSRAAEVICSRAYDGLVAAKAHTLILGDKRQEDAKIPAAFWWAKGNGALNQKWASGDFDTWIRNKVHWRAYGVKFLKRDIVSMLPAGRLRSSAPNPSIPVGAATFDTGADGQLEPVARGGRPKSENWTNWIAELVTYIYEEGIPGGSGAEGQDAIIGALEERLAARGLDTLSRSTVQPVVRATLLRLRSAGN